MNRIFPALLLCGTLALGAAGEKSDHVFSVTCKVTAMNNQFATAEGRRLAVDWFKEHLITKVYLETYRHAEEVTEARMIEVRNDFTAAGLEVGGCITTTMMNRTRTPRPLVVCYSDPEALAYLKEIVERTARVFDFIILDDFLFTDCKCAGCEKARTGRPWNVFRTDLMLEVSRKYILEPARAANPKCSVIIKYPCWYEGYSAGGYDVLRETELFGASWIGTETREPDSPSGGKRPQTQASWIQGWMNAVSQGKCGGAWFDPIDTKPETYVEQARQTIIGGAKESLLHCFDYLATEKPGIAIHGTDLQVKNGFADAEAFRREAVALKQLAKTLAPMTPYGVLLPKKPNVDNEKEPYFCSFVSLLGIPALAAAELKESPAFLLSTHSSKFENVEEYLSTAWTQKKPFVLTDSMLRGLTEPLRTKLLAGGTLAESGQPFFTRKISDQFTVLHLRNGNYWEMLKMAPAEIDSLRHLLLKPFGLQFSAPAKVSLHLFKSDDSRLEIVENFNDVPVTARLELDGAPARQLKQSFPTPDSIRFSQDGRIVTLEIQPRSMAVIGGK